VGERRTKKEVALYKGKLKSSELPEKVDLAEVTSEMDGLWEKSVLNIKGGEVKEHAATLVLDSNGSLRMDNVVEGGPSSVIPDRDVGADKTLVGTFHTHPYPDGRTGMAFSGTDIAYALINGDTLPLVQSGQDVFGLVRTEKTPALVNWADLEAEFDVLFDEYVIEDGMSDQEAALVTNLDLCKRYGLAFYLGKSDGKLEVVYKP
jgi:hypothetical protein